MHKDFSHLSMYDRVSQTLTAATLQSCGQGPALPINLFWTFVIWGGWRFCHSKWTTERSTYFCAQFFIVETLAMRYRELCTTRLSRNWERIGKVIGTDDTSANGIFHRPDRCVQTRIPPCRLWLTLIIFPSSTRITAPLSWPPGFGPAFVAGFVAGRISW